MAKTVVCERLQIVGTLLDSGVPVLDFSVPAYTRTWNSLEALVRNYFDDYKVKTERAGVKPSMADFALYLLAQAHNEPTSQEADG